MHLTVSEMSSVSFQVVSQAIGGGVGGMSERLKSSGCEDGV